MLDFDHKNLAQLGNSCDKVPEKNQFFQNPTSRHSWTDMSTTANTWIIRTRLGGRTEDNLEFPSEKKIDPAAAQCLIGGGGG